MPTYPIELKQPDGTVVKFGRAGMVNRSPLVPADKSLIWNLLADGAESAEIVHKIRERRQLEGLAEVEEKWVKRAVTWARKQMSHNLESQKLNTTEQKRNKRIINSLIDEYEEIGNYCTTKLKENPDIIREEWYRNMLQHRLKLVEHLHRLTDRAKVRGIMTLDDMKRQKEKNPFIGQEKYSEQLPSHMVEEERVEVA